ncbi:hypothetical protein H4S06_003067, partial [Coemansia sp. BCRC 34490]
MNPSNINPGDYQPQMQREVDADSHPSQHTRAHPLTEPAQMGFTERIGQPAVSRVLPQRLTLNQLLTLPMSQPSVHAMAARSSVINRFLEYVYPDAH